MKPFKERVINFWEVFTGLDEYLRKLCDNMPEKRYELYYVSELIINNCFPRCSYTLEKGDNDRYRLILSPYCNPLIILYLRYWVALAPKQLYEHWDFLIGDQKTNDLDFKMKVDGFEFGFHDLYIHPDIRDDHIDIKVYAENFKYISELMQIHVSYQLLVACLGEIDIMYLLKRCEMSEEKLDGSFPLDQFPAYIKDVIKKRRWINAHDPFRVYKSYIMKPRTRETSLRDDMYYGITTQKKLMDQAFVFEDFQIRRAKDCGIYVGFIFYEHTKIRRRDDLIEQREEKITNICEKIKIAENIGHACGVYYSYIDYVIYDWESFVGVMTEFLSDVDTSVYGFHFFASHESPFYIVNNESGNIN